MAEQSPDNKHGIPCPQCEKQGKRVLESRYRMRSQSTVRRCECRHCGFRFTTKEFVAIDAEALLSREKNRIRSLAFKTLAAAINELSISEDLS